MARCRVTFRDLEHQLFRRVEVDAESPVDAAQAGLRWMLEHDFFVEDFGPSVKVEVVTTIEHNLPLRALSQRSICAPKAQVA